MAVATAADAKTCLSFTRLSTVTCPSSYRGSGPFFCALLLSPFRSRLPTRSPAGKTHAHTAVGLSPDAITQTPLASLGRAASALQHTGTLQVLSNSLAPPAEPHAPPPNVPLSLFSSLQTNTHTVFCPLHARGPNQICLSVRHARCNLLLLSLLCCCLCCCSPMFSRTQCMQLYVRPSHLDTTSAPHGAPKGEKGHARIAHCAPLVIR